MRGDPGVREKTRQRILATAGEMNSRPNEVARALASRSQRTIGILIGNILSPFEELLASACDSALLVIRDDTVLAIKARAEAEVDRAVLRPVAKYIAGLILIGSPRDPALIRQIAARVATVCVGRNISGIGVSSVSINDLMDVRLSTPCLIGKGHRRIAHISGAGARGPVAKRWRRLS